MVALEAELPVRTRRRIWLWAAMALVPAAVLLAAPVFLSAAVPEPGFCASCHVMEPVRASWATSLHKDAATCTTCHTPANPAGKLLAKYTDGARHVWAQAAGSIPDPIQLRAHSEKVVVSNCIVCHSEQSIHTRVKAQQGRSCLECHQGHSHASVVLPVN